MNLYKRSSAWSQERVVESMLYAKTRNTGSLPIIAAEASAGSYEFGLEADPRQKTLQQKAQSLFNQLCERSCELIIDDLRAGINVDDAVDAAFDDEIWAETMREIMRVEQEMPSDPNEMLERETLRGRFPWAVTNPVSPKTKNLAKRVVALLNAIDDAHHNLNQARIPLGTSVSQEMQIEDHLWFMADLAIAPDMRRGLLAQRRGMLAMIATYPVTTPSPVRGAFAYVVRLLEFCAQSFEEYLAVLANMPAAEVDIVRADGSNLTLAKTEDVISPFREALNRGGDANAADR